MTFLSAFVSDQRIPSPLHPRALLSCLLPVFTTPSLKEDSENFARVLLSLSTIHFVFCFSASVVSLRALHSERTFSWISKSVSLLLFFSCNCVFLAVLWLSFFFISFPPILSLSFPLLFLLSPPSLCQIATFCFFCRLLFLRVNCLSLDFYRLQFFFLSLRGYSSFQQNVFLSFFSERSNLSSPSCSRRGQERERKEGKTLLLLLSLSVKQLLVQGVPSLSPSHHSQELVFFIPFSLLHFSPLFFASQWIFFSPFFPPSSPPLLFSLSLFASLPFRLSLFVFSTALASFFSFSPFGTCSGSLKRLKK